MKTMSDTTNTTTNTPATTKWPLAMLYQNRLWHWYGLRSSDGRLLLACPDDPARGCRAAEEDTKEADEPDSQKP